MPTTFAAIATAVLLSCLPLQANAAPTDANRGARPAVAALSERWQGRHNYLYEDENQPDPAAATTGAAPSDARGCSSEPVRMRRSDGSTVVRRLPRCE